MGCCSKSGNWPGLNSLLRGERTTIGFVKNPIFAYCQTNSIHMGLKDKNTVLAWATFIMIFVGVGLIALGAFRYDEIAGWGFASVGIGFFAIAWVFNALKGRV